LILLIAFLTFETFPPSYSLVSASFASLLIGISLQLTFNVLYAVKEIELKTISQNTIEKTLSFS
jgi:hypothetical protein